jgi:hypothetical protein
VRYGNRYENVSSGSTDTNKDSVEVVFGRLQEHFYNAPEESPEAKAERIASEDAITMERTQRAIAALRAKLEKEDEPYQCFKKKDDGVKVVSEVAEVVPCVGLRGRAIEVLKAKRAEYEKTHRVDPYEGKAAWRRHWKSLYTVYYPYFNGESDTEILVSTCDENYKYEYAILASLMGLNSYNGIALSFVPSKIIHYTLFDLINRAAKEEGVGNIKDRARYVSSLLQRRLKIHGYDTSGDYKFKIAIANQFGLSDIPIDPQFESFMQTVALKYISTKALEVKELAIGPSEGGRIQHKRSNVVGKKETCGQSLFEQKCEKKSVSEVSRSISGANLSEYNSIKTVSNNLRFEPRGEILPTEREYALSYALRETTLIQCNILEDQKLPGESDTVFRMSVEKRRLYATYLDNLSVLSYELSQKQASTRFLCKIAYENALKKKFYFLKDDFDLDNPIKF